MALATWAVQGSNGPCKSGVLGGRGTHGGTHRADTLEQFRPVDLAIVEERVCIAVSRDQLRALADELADLRPRAPLPVQERDAAVAERVRREVRNAGIAAGATDRRPQPIGAEASEERRRRVTILTRRAGARCTSGLRGERMAVGELRSGATGKVGRI